MIKLWLNIDARAKLMSIVVCFCCYGYHCRRRQLSFETWSFPIVKNYKMQPSTFTCFFFFFFFLILERALLLLGRLAIAQENNSPRANLFPAGDANFGQAMYRSLERSPQDTSDGFDLWSAQASLLGRALIWPDHFGTSTFGLLGLYHSSLSKSAGFASLARKASLVSVPDAILLRFSQTCEL